MMLSDNNICTAMQLSDDNPLHIRIEPNDVHYLQPASYDLRLGNAAVVYDHYRSGSRLIDTHDKSTYEAAWCHHIHNFKYIDIEPQQFVIATTLETIELGSQVAARMEGKSSIGRLGMLMHVTAGFVDPGFRGQLTLEMFNLNNCSIRLYAGDPICQLSFMQLHEPAAVPYHGKYQDQSGPTISAYHENFPVDSVDASHG